MIELKVGNNGLEQKQFDTYHVLAKEYKFNSLITVSNQPALPNGHPPLKVHKGRIKSIPVFHLSWERLLSEAQMLSWQSVVADEDHQFILEEWIRYVTDEKSKIVVAPSVGQYWKNLITQAGADKLSTIKSDVEEFIHTWNGFLRIEAFRLRAMLGESVEVRLSRSELNDPELFTKRLVVDTLANNRVDSALKIPRTAGDLNVIFDIKGKMVFLEVHIKPPIDKTTKGQIGWMVGQFRRLENVPVELMLLVDWKRHGAMSSAPIKDIGDNREKLMISSAKEVIDKDNDIRLFRIQWATSIPRKGGDFFTTLGQKIEEFYGGVVSHLTTYTPPAPKVSAKVEIATGQIEPVGMKERSVSAQGNPTLNLPSWENKNE